MEHRQGLCVLFKWEVEPPTVLVHDRLHPVMFVACRFKGGEQRATAKLSTTFANTHVTVNFIGVTVFDKQYLCFCGEGDPW